MAPDGTSSEPPDPALDQPDSAASTAGLFTLLREDFRAHGGSLVHPGFHALAVYRIGHWRLGRHWLIRLPVTIWYKFMERIVMRIVYGVEIADEAVIGRRVKIGHHQSLQIPAFCVIGDDSMLRHNITIGFASAVAGRYEVPKLGRRVQIGAGAFLLGAITIGDQAIIGPAAIITMNVPAGATAFAAPARVMTQSAPAPAPAPAAAPAPAPAGRTGPGSGVAPVSASGPAPARAPGPAAPAPVPAQSPAPVPASEPERAESTSRRDV